MSSASTIGREPITIVEIDQDLCVHVYGEAPCMAVLGVTGEAKCFNCIASCQDIDNYLLSYPLILRFGIPHEGLPRDVTIFPSLVSVTSVASRINVGAGDPEASPLGQRAQITATFRDHPYHDRLVDPYVDTRNYDPMTRGTFWAKWLTRNPYYQNRALRVRQGYVGQALANMRVRHFVMDRIEGPDNGLVKVIAVDPLKLLNDVRVKVPGDSRGLIDADIDEASNLIGLSPSGIGNAEYATSGIGRLGSELVSFTRSSDTIALTARGLRGTVASTHSLGDLFQEVLVIEGQRVDLLLADLMINYAGIDGIFIPTAEWDEEASVWCAGFDHSAWITEPTGVQSLINEILASTACFIWWDEEDQIIKFRATRPYSPYFDVAPVEVSDDRNVVADSFSIEYRPTERITQVYVYWSQINPTGAVDDPANYARRRVVRDADAESAERYGDSRIKIIFGRLFDDENDAATLVIATRLLQRYRETPKLIRFSTDAKEESLLRAGTVIELTHRDLVDLTGAAFPTTLQLTASEEVDPGHRFEFEARQMLLRDRYSLIVENDAPDYLDASIDEQAAGGWIAADADGFANGDPPYRIL